MRQILLTALIAFVAAIAGVLIGRALIPPRPAPSAELHTLLHHHLDLDAAQQAKLDELEAGFATRRAALEAELRADNEKLAAAIEAEHGNGPQVTASVDRSHRAMGELQKATLSHIFAMRQILRPDQAARFDAAVTHALTADAR
ncbi:periplasmic heavy metal sensor [Sphingomonas oryzagri]